MIRLTTFLVASLLLVGPALGQSVDPVQVGEMDLIIFFEDFTTGPDDELAEDLTPVHKKFFTAIKEACDGVEEANRKMDEGVVAHRCKGEEEIRAMRDATIVWELRKSEGR